MSRRKQRKKKAMNYYDAAYDFEQGLYTVPSGKFVDCHTGNVFAFADPKSGLRFYGGGNHKHCTFPAGWIVIDCADVFPPTAVVVGMVLPNFQKLVVEKRIKLYWPDMKIPYLDVDAWKALIVDLRNLAKKSGQVETHVLVCCMGGHGRTGTGLAVLAGLLGVSQTPIEFVRKVYCKEAVETIAQIDYIAEVTGYKEPEQKSSKVFGTYTPVTPTPGYTVKLTGAVGTVVGKYTAPIIEATTKEGLDEKEKDVTCFKCHGPKMGDFCICCRKLERYCTCE
jgi:hypothetical protein